jgi:hypothetical protein
MTNPIEELKEKIATMQHNLKVLEQLEASTTDVEKAYRDAYGHYPETSSFAVSDWDVISWEAFQKGYEAAQPKEVSVEEQTKPMEEVVDRLENKWNSAAENSASYITDEVVDRLIKQQQAQKLYNRLYDELGYDFEDIENIVSLVEDWLPDYQNASGSQNVNTELLVEGFNDAIRKMKEMLR